MVAFSWFILSVGLNVILIATLWGFLRKKKRAEQELINVGQALAYRDMLDSLSRMVNGH